jgi:hypothetical protein
MGPRGLLEVEAIAFQEIEVSSSHRPVSFLAEVNKQADENSSRNVYSNEVVNIKILIYSLSYSL